MFNIVYLCGVGLLLFFLFFCYLFGMLLRMGVYLLCIIDLDVDISICLLM